MSHTVPNVFQFSLIQLDKSAKTPLYRQLYAGIREAVLTKELAPGVRLPSTRDLADILDVSRNTVQNAYDQLVAEGYLEPKVGSGTYVTESLPEDLLYVSPEDSTPAAGPQSERTLSQRGTTFVQLREQLERYSAENQHPDNVFSMNTTDLDIFPFETWRDLAWQQYTHSSPELFSYQPGAGYEPLREAIAEYLRTARGVRCEPAQIIVVSGSQEALFLAAQVLLDPGDVAWMEEPGYWGAKRALRSAGATIVPISVDADGLDVDIARDRAPAARLAYVTPSHQFPLGYTMSLGRRFQLLQWAERAGAWILEDDYDSEYRYSGRPLAALQGLDASNRVIYIGTFSKVLFPALRLGYIVAPADLVDAFVAARTLVDIHPPSIDQAVLTDFITEGHFTRHIRRMRKRYAERNAAFVETAKEELEGLLKLGPADAGMHVVGWLPERLNDRAAAKRAAAHDIEARPLSHYCLETPERGGLVLGYGGAAPADIRAGVRRLATALSEMIAR